MNRTIQSIFIAHPASVDETYFQHLRFALGFSLRLFGAGMAALIHALIPCLFEKTASNLIRDMHRRIVTR
ncbi:MAG: hypothetical protein HKN18_17345 [Silicimonas sp.]|mgnify:CR=1 FL=1|nr:hypothetical protein [Silicimonas sp.]